MPKNFLGKEHTSPRASSAPMSERQQVALLMQLTNPNNQQALEANTTRQRAAKSKTRNEHGETPLHIAARRGEVEQVKDLLHRGIDPNVSDFAGWTPLHEACNHGHIEIAGILIDAGGGVDARGLDDITPLHDAAINGYLNIVKLLIEKGADPLSRNSRGKIPLDIARPQVREYLSTLKELEYRLIREQKKNVYSVIQSQLKNSANTSAGSTSSSDNLNSITGRSLKSSYTSDQSSPQRSYDIFKPSSSESPTKSGKNKSPKKSSPLKSKAYSFYTSDQSNPQRSYDIFKPSSSESPTKSGKNKSPKKSSPLKSKAYTSTSSNSCSSRINIQANSYQTNIDAKNEIDSKIKCIFPVTPKPPVGFDDYLINRRTYTLNNNAPEQVIKPPHTLPQPLVEIFMSQEKDRNNLRNQHMVEKQKLVLAVEQEIIRVHGKAARALVNQELPFSVCSIRRAKEYGMLTPEREEKDRNSTQRARYSGRLFLSWLQQIDDKWEKIKEDMITRHHHEAESLYASQCLDWKWKLQELRLPECKLVDTNPEHLPKVIVTDDFDLSID